MRSIRSIIISRITASDRILPQVRNAIRTVIQLPALQHLHFQRVNMPRLVPAVANPTLTRITLDSNQRTNEDNIQLLHLCAADSASLQELHLTGITDVVDTAVFLNGMFLGQFENVRSSVLRFRLAASRRIFLAFILI